MVYIWAVGYDVPYEIWKQAYDDLEACQHGCSVNHTGCGQGCLEAFPSPPLENIPRALACLEECSATHRACLDLCMLNFWLELGFNGVPADNKDPAEEFKNKHVPKLKDIGGRMVGIGAALAFAGGMAGVIGGQRGRRGLVYTAALVTFSAGLIVYAGNEIRSVDPPDDDFAQIFRPRRFRIRDLLPADLLLESGAALLFMTLLSEALLTVSYLEGLNVSLDRAFTALDAGDMEKHFAQLRVSQRYAKACSESFKRMQDARLVVANKLRGLSVEVDEAIPRLMVAALVRELAVNSVQESGRLEQSLMITYADAIELQQQWVQEGIPEFIRHFIEQITPSGGEARSIINDILGVDLAREDFDKPISAILQNSELTAAENEVMQVLNEWEGFYR